MKKSITQRELRNDSAAVLREVQAGQSVIVTRNGDPVAELRPLPSRRFVPRARRQDRLQWVASTFDALPFDGDAARAYGRIFVAVHSTGRSHRTRLADLLIASTAAANGLAVYTRNPGDFRGLERIVKVIAI